MVLTLAGCAPGPRSIVPAELPLTTNQDVFTIRWALQKEPAVVRAVGLINTTNLIPVQVTLGFFGLDAGGRILSRGTDFVRPDSFSSRSIPFSVELTPTGQEAKFELRILDYRLQNMRSN
jgi:hypothetical protein